MRDRQALTTPPPGRSITVRRLREHRDEHVWLEAVLARLGRPGATNPSEALASADQVLKAYRERFVDEEGHAK